MASALDDGREWGLISFKL